MKKTIIITLILSLCSGFWAEAQLLKKLKDKAANAVEKTLEKKVEEKAEKTTEDTVDDVFDSSEKKNKNQTEDTELFSVSNILNQSDKTPNASYSFTHKYVLEVSDNKNKMQTTYYLNKEQNYLGSKTSLDSKSNDGVVTIMDYDQKAIFSLMDVSGQKMIMTQDMGAEVFDQEDDQADISIQKTGKTKQILGYQCEEFLVTGDTFKSTFWVTKQAGVQFLNLPSDSKNKNAFDSKWLDYAEGLLMEMSMTDTSGNKPQQMTVRCVELKKESITINTKDYK